MSDLNIYQKLANIRKQVEIMKKDARAYGYNYVKEEDILAKVTVFMEEYNLKLAGKYNKLRKELEKITGEKDKKDII